MDKIAMVTDRQLRNIYFRARDKHGQLVHESNAEPFDYKAEFWETWQSRGWPEHLIQQKWAAYCEEAAKQDARKYGS
jgi:hypothetical protein